METIENWSLKIGHWLSRLALDKAEMRPFGPTGPAVPSNPAILQKPSSANVMRQ
jgi:hypothetical protein